MIGRWNGPVAATTRWASITPSEVSARNPGRPAFRCTEIRRNGPCGLKPADCRRPCEIAAAFAGAEAAYREALAARTLELTRALKFESALPIFENNSVTIATLMVLMVVKFYLVATWFMHLKFDNPIFGRMFVGGLVLATGVYVIALSAFEFWA